MFDHLLLILFLFVVHGGADDKVVDFGNTLDLGLVYFDYWDMMVVCYFVDLNF
jgi:hypothetical protein